LGIKLANINFPFGALSLQLMLFLTQISLAFQFSLLVSVTKRNFFN